MLAKRFSPNFQAAFFKAAIVLIPSYSIAYLTDKMVYVVPTLAAAGMFAATIQTKDVTRMLDDGGSEASDLENEQQDNEASESTNHHSHDAPSFNHE